MHVLFNPKAYFHFHYVNFTHFGAFNSGELKIVWKSLNGQPQKCTFIELNILFSRNRLWYFLLFLHENLSCGCSLDFS